MNEQGTTSAWLGSDLAQEERDLFRQKESKHTKSKGIKDHFFAISDLKKQPNTVMGQVLSKGREH